MGPAVAHGLEAALAAAHAGHRKMSATFESVTPHDRICRGNELGTCARASPRPPRNIGPHLFLRSRFLLPWHVFPME